MNLQFRILNTIMTKSYCRGTTLQRDTTPSYVSRVPESRALFAGERFPPGRRCCPGGGGYCRRARYFFREFSRDSIGVRGTPEVTAERRTGFRRGFYKSRGQHLACDEKTAASSELILSCFIAAHISRAVAPVQTELSLSLSYPPRTCVY